MDEKTSLSKRPFMDENVTLMDENFFFWVMYEKVTLWIKQPKLWKIKKIPA
jgi:hypothetical protein